MRWALPLAGLLVFALPSGCKGNIGEAGGSDGAGQGGSGSTDPGGIPVASRIPRLSHTQYDNTIQDLFNAPQLTPSSALPPAAVGSLDERAWTGYKESATALAKQAVSTPAILDAILPCAPAGDEAACAKSFIQDFGLRAFRRPLSDKEVATFEGLFARRAELTAGGQFNDGVELLLEAFLQSPSFLTRAELSTQVSKDKIPLNSYEVASRLSYTLTNSMPDRELLDAAAADRLTTAEGIRAQAERLLKLPRARAAVQNFHEHWLQMQGSEGSRWTDFVRDEALYPDFSPETLPYLKQETLRFIDYIVFEKQGGYQALLTDNTGFVNNRTAPLYGLNAADFGADLTQTPLDPTQRSGLLTRVGFLASHAQVVRTSPILRGALIQKHILCRSIGTPPPGAEMTPLPAVTKDVVTTRQRVALQTSPEECNFCHKIINPTGFAFEHYNAVGAWQTQDTGVDVDATGTALIGTREVPYAGGVEFSALVSTAPEAHRCYAKNWVEFAYGRRAKGSDTQIIASLGQKLNTPSYSILQLLLDLVQTETFRSRAPEVSQ